MLLVTNCSLVVADAVENEDDVIYPPPGHLLLISLGPSSATKLVQATVENCDKIPAQAFVTNSVGIVEGLGG